MEFDHLFLCVSDQALEADLLVEAGVTDVTNHKQKIDVVASISSVASGSGTNLNLISRVVVPTVHKE